MFYVFLAAVALLSGLIGFFIGGHAVALVFTLCATLIGLGVRDLARHKHAIFAGTALAAVLGWHFGGPSIAVVAAILAFPLQIAIHDFTLRKNIFLPVALTFTFLAWWQGWVHFGAVPGIALALLTFLTQVGINDYWLQRTHTIRRNFPLLGWFRYGFELIGDELRQYWFMSDTEERPYDRETRKYIYRSAKGINNNLGFGTVRRYRDVGEIHILPAMYPNPETQAKGNRLPPLVIGKKRRKPYYCPWPIAVSGMSFGAISPEGVKAMASGAKEANIHMMTGEGGLTNYHLDGVVRRLPFDVKLAFWRGCLTHYLSFGLVAKPAAPVREVVGGGRIGVQIGPAKFGFRRFFMDPVDSDHGREFRKRWTSDLDLDKVRALADNDQIPLIEVKLAQGAKPGQGGKLPKEKITAELAEWRGIPMDKDCYSPNSWDEFGDPKKSRLVLVKMLQELTSREDLSDAESRLIFGKLLDELNSRDDFSQSELLLVFITILQELTGKPTGIKIVVGQDKDLREIARLIKKAGRGPDFITVDGGEGGTGAAPVALADTMGLPILHAIPKVDTILREHGIRDEVVLMGSGQIAKGSDVAIAIAMGVDMVNIGRGNLIAEGCIMARRCHTNTCPVGVATQDPRLRRGLDPEDKYTKVANYNLVLQRELLMICRSVGVSHPWELSRHHLSVVTSPMVEENMAEIHPYPDASEGKRNPLLGALPPDDPEHNDQFGPKLIKIGLIDRKPKA